MLNIRKNVGWSTLVASAAAMVMFFAAQGAMAAIGTIVGSKHDFSSTGTSTYKGTSNQVCVYCHAPHNTSATPLWNHASTSTSFTLYTSPTFSATGTIGQPGSVSKLCLSCHDGTVAVDSFGGATGTKLIAGANAANLGTDLSNDHPIGFTYDAALVTADGGLKATTAAVTVGDGSVAGTIASRMLTSSKMECASCHDVHNSAANTAVESKLLKITTAGSALCIACHNK